MRRLYRLKLNQRLPEYKHSLFTRLHDSPAKLTTIYGSRGIGKTTLLMQLLHASALPTASTLYISCNLPMFQDVSLYDFVEAWALRKPDKLYLAHPNLFEAYQVEIGGKNKGFEQLKWVEQGYVVCDDIEVRFDHRVPLWLLGFLR
ncbi:AAA family ATPase [Thiomicrospira sp. R3]|uniref:AAA family ATPase n=1 Tax=Thiomicrospira sp. R3 TaxID=3035472 RepID=UPI00259B1EB2|nr:AAA family ATPase [Thiomicrospira sp. R3]WFE69552.1 AAA family ATPase [Thiomicrospira sp. R3]